MLMVIEKINKQGLEQREQYGQKIKEKENII
jgi:hypothetical protein